MVVTRDPDVPVEAANLFQAFNRCAVGHDGATILQASINFLIGAIHFAGREGGLSLAEMIEQANEIGEKLPGYVATQWERTPLPTDIYVPFRGN
jgi:hypothetical protein